MIHHVHQAAVASDGWRFGAALALVAVCMLPAAAGAQSPVPAPAQPAPAQPAPTQPAQPAPAAAAPAEALTLKLAWKEPIDPAAVRIAVADTVGDGKQRVVMLCRADTGATKVSVARWQDGAFKQEWSADLSEPDATFAVGRFDPGVPAAQIVTGRTWFAWDGKAYAKHDLDKPIDPAGVLQRRDHTAILLVRDTGSFAAYTLSTRNSSKPLVQVKSLPDDGAFFFGRMVASPADLETQLPPDYAATGFFGFWNPAEKGRPLRLVAQYVAQGVKPTSYAVVASAVGQNAVFASWRSDPLDGRILDIDFGDPKNEGAPGLAVLTGSADGKTRTLTLFVPVNVPLPAK